MNKPILIIVTGRPGDGKTTLSEAVSQAWCLPLISRDRIKEGCVHTIGQAHDALPDDANLIATRVFFDALAIMLDRGISVVAEAAFQHPVWLAGLQLLKDKARVVVLICCADKKTVLDRLLTRGIEDAQHSYFHGDGGVRMLQDGMRPKLGNYCEPCLDAETIHVDTSDGYQPTLQVLHSMIFHQRNDRKEGSYAEKRNVHHV